MIPNVGFTGGQNADNHEENGQEAEKIYSDQKASFLMHAADDRLELVNDNREVLL